MRAVPAVHGWHPLLNESGGRGPRSQVLATLPRPLRQRAKGSAGAFPRTAPGQLFSLAGYFQTAYVICTFYILVSFFSSHFLYSKKKLTILKTLFNT